MQHEHAAAGPANAAAVDSGPGTGPTRPREVTYRNEERDTVAAFQSFYRARMRTWRTAAAGAGVLAALLAAALALGVERPVLLLGLVGGVAGGLAVFLVSLRLRVLAAARRTYRQQLHLQEEYHVAWDASGLRVRTPNLLSRTPWTHYRRWHEDAHVVLLHQSDQLFQFLPKRVLTEAQVADLRALASAAGVPGA